MPELPEVETTRRGIARLLTGRIVHDVVVRQRRLRWPVPGRLREHLAGQRLEAVSRRGKYLLLGMPEGTLIVHLGMSGSLCIVRHAPPRKHDHVDLIFDDGWRLRLHDPRRFGAVLWTRGAVSAHPLLRRLGPEPLSNDFSAEHLRARANGRRIAVKSFIMDSSVVAGIGNIYATEALYLARIHPARAAGRVSLERYRRMVLCIRQVLLAALDQGGTTLRDFVNSDGAPGYFALKLHAYGRAGKPCERCAAPMRSITLGQRASAYCACCQH